MSILALDIGGTAVKYGIFTSKEEYGQFSVLNTDGMEKLPEKIIEFILHHPTDRIGISAPGPFDFETGTSLMEHKLPSLYHVSLQKMIEKECPDTPFFFIHDSTAFILGAIQENKSLSKKNISGIMLGTGLGYVHCINGKIEVNERKTPLHPLWNTPYKSSIAEHYVSATAIIQKAKEKGYVYGGVKELAEMARQGNKQLLDVFFDTGTQLGELVHRIHTRDGFQKLIIGGQVSKAWDLMQIGFEKTCSIMYDLVKNPIHCPLLGIKYCAEKGIKNIYKEISI